MYVFALAFTVATIGTQRLVPSTQFSCDVQSWIVPAEHEAAQAAPVVFVTEYGHSPDVLAVPERQQRRPASQSDALSHRNWSAGQTAAGVRQPVVPLVVPV